MNILVDNTGFQHFGVLLNPKLISDSFTDHEISETIDDFLQICIQVIIYEDITVSSLVPKSVQEVSTEIIGEIQKLDKSIFDVDTLRKQEKDIEKIKDNIAIDFYDRIEKILKKQNIGSKGNITHLKPETKRILEYGTAVIAGKQLENIEKLAIDSRVNKTDSSFFDIVTREVPGERDRIIDKILAYRDYGIDTWTIPISLKLIEELRFASNQNISQWIKRPYSAAVTRARSFFMDGEHYQLSLDTLFEKISELRFMNFKLSMPSIKDALLVAGKGRPESILKETLKLRNTFEPFREILKAYEFKKYGKIEYMKRQKILDNILNDLYCEYAQSMLNSNPSTVNTQIPMFTLYQVIQNINGNNNTAANGTDGTRETRGILKKDELNKYPQGRALRY